MTGRTLGHYHVADKLGAGGMGEVYRAHDTKLGRDVAIKVLPLAFTATADSLARFEREARLLAALNHPNIATIYGFEELDAGPGPAHRTVHALVLELIDGETLADRIRNAAVGRRRREGTGTAADPPAASGLPADDALRIARQIADALDAAHEKGIVHRDLKPANIKVTPDGLVKVLDFGIAKLAPAPAIDATAGAPASTVTIGGTGGGVAIGTPAYMSPEQARGEPVDKRTDIWAFGCVLFEMLTGRGPFVRPTGGEAVAAVLDHEPDWQALPESTPPPVRRLLRRCLEKEAKRRTRDMGDVRADLEDAAAADTVAPASRVPAAGRRRRAGWMAAGALGSAAIIGTLIWASRKTDSTADPVVTRTTLTLPPNLELDTGDGAGPLAISPDGRRIAYVAVGDGRTQLYVRSLDVFTAEAVAGTDGARYPFFSPDGAWVAFFADRKLKRVSIQGGSPLTICDAPSIGRGGTWRADGTIVFDPGASGLMRVSAAGAQPEPLTSGDPAMDRNNLSWPHFLPDGRALLATVGPTGGVGTTLAVLSMDTGEWHPLGPGSQAQYLAPGHLIYHAIGVREGELHAVGFDAEALTLRGTPFSVLDSVFRAQDAGAAYFAVGGDGTLTFTPGGYARTLVRVDRHGRRTPLVADRRGFRRPAVSPDGLSVAVTIDPRPSQIWVYDIARGSRTALATEGHSLSPVWTPDGRRIAYTSDRPQVDILWRAADAGSAAERLLVRDGAQFPTSWSADGSQLIFTDGVPDAYDVWVLTVGGEARPLIATAHSELSGQLSPDGRWLAYESNESGRFEIYVRPYPNVGDRKVSISTAGGQQPRWARGGQELFYVVGSAVMSVRVDTTGTTLVAGTPELLFSGPFDTSYTQYAVTPEGTHFIMVEVDPNARPTQLNVVLNWGEEVKRSTGTPHAR